MSHRNPDDEQMRALLQRVKRIAVVGLSPKPYRDSNGIARFLIDEGYDVVPVYPREEQILGQKVYRRVQDIPGGVDLVDVFRRSEDLPQVTAEAVAAGAPALWFQLGCVNEDAAATAAAAGIQVVMNRCIRVDYARLIAR